MKILNIAIIGCGLIGMKRARALGSHKLAVACDPKLERAERICSTAGRGIALTDWKEAIRSPGVDVVIVSTSNNWLTPVSIEALQNNKHILVEKPGARSAAEMGPFYRMAGDSSCKVKVGFNLRYHPALMKAREIVDSGIMGKLMFIRGRYGHGGRVGYEKEWRADPVISGGGELIDQGVHMIDLCRWFLGDFVSVKGEAVTYFWDMPVDDNAFFSLSTSKKQVAWIHVSCTEWKNMFSLEIYGRTGKIQIDGLGGSYGMEKLTYYNMRPEMGPPDTTVWEYPGEDLSWDQEFKAFAEAINTGSAINGGINDAYEALKIVDKIYNRTGE